jgi:DNA-binding response OmpR family regulator
MKYLPMRILLIEDNPGDARLIQELLAEANGRRFEVVWCNNLVRGLDRLSAADIAALMLDLSLPDSQGKETLAQVRAAAPGLPIVVLTALDDEELGQELVQAGAQDYLIKGQITAILLGRAIRYAIERKRAQTERERLIAELQSALASIKILRLLLPICASCKRIRNDQGYWQHLESYISQHSDAKFTHGICPECAKKYFAEFASEEPCLPG